MPERGFQDGTPLAEGVGTTARRTMPIQSTAWSAWMFWDGRKDSPWSQALGPLESPVEHGGTRAQYAHLVAEEYRADYEAVFGPLPDLSGVPRRAGPGADPVAAEAWASLPDSARESVTRVFVNVGKAIAAYERRIRHGESRFDRWADALVTTGRAPEGVLSKDEVAGLRLFIGEAGCVSCHNGPLFTDDFFYNTGVPEREGSTPETLDLGRRAGAEQVLADELNCRSRYSDAPDRCAELDFIVVDSEEMVRAFKTPSLRGVAERAPYMHAGQIATLEDVVRHDERAPRGAGRPERAPPAAALRARDPSARLHSADYRSPAELPDGPALVVGGGNSGVQIAAELAETRPTTLAVGSKLPRLPQRVLGRSIFDWLERLGAMDVTVESRLGRHMSGHDVLIGESPERIARALGVRLAGRAVGVQGAGVRTADGEVVSACTVVWATGWRADHAWLRVPVADAGGRIVHRRGVSEVPGPSFLGLPWMHTRGSALLGWVGRDATYLAGRIAARAEAHATAGFAGSARRAGLAQRRARWAAM